MLRFGGYTVQGRGEAGEQLRRDAQAVVDAGASLIVLECVPTPIAAQVSAELGVPTIGIGAGPGCDGQVLVMHDMLGLDSGHRRPKFVKDFLAEGTRWRARCALTPGPCATAVSPMQRTRTPHDPDPDRSFHPARAGHRLEA